MSLNIVTIEGNITADLEPRFLEPGSMVLNFSIASNEKWKDDQGQPQERTTFVDVTAWKHTAKFLSEYAKKGAKVVVSGKLKEDKWQDKETGHNRSKLIVEARDVVLMSKSDSHPTQQFQQPQQQQYQQVPPNINNLNRCHNKHRNISSISNRNDNFNK